MPPPPTAIMDPVPTSIMEALLSFKPRKRSDTINTAEVARTATTARAHIAIMSSTSKRRNGMTNTVAVAHTATMGRADTAIMSSTPSNDPHCLTKGPVTLL
jgi:hypothetical protein